MLVVEEELEAAEPSAAAAGLAALGNMARIASAESISNCGGMALLFLKKQPGQRRSNGRVST